MSEENAVRYSFWGPIAFATVAVGAYLIILGPRAIKRVKAPNGLYGPYMYDLWPSYWIGIDWLVPVYVGLSLWTVIVARWTWDLTTS
jgi:hypothetical protein